MGAYVGESHPFSGEPMVLLHHRGARARAERATPLGYKLRLGQVMP